MAHSQQEDVESRGRADVEKRLRLDELEQRTKSAKVSVHCVALIKLFICEYDRYHNQPVRQTVCLTNNSDARGGPSGTMFLSIIEGKVEGKTNMDG